MNHAAPWCEIAQNLTAGFLHVNDEKKLDLASIYKEVEHDWTDTRVSYTPQPDGHVLFNVTSHNKYYTDSCLVPAKEIGCKMASADRVA